VRDDVAEARHVDDQVDVEVQPIARGNRLAVREEVEQAATRMPQPMREACSLEAKPGGLVPRPSDVASGPARGGSRGAVERHTLVAQK
jgi:hypothetical protein